MAKPIMTNGSALLLAAIPSNSQSLSSNTYFKVIGISLGWSRVIRSSNGRTKPHQTQGSGFEQAYEEIFSDPRIYYGFTLPFGVKIHMILFLSHFDMIP